jgi:hypothetical protein
VRRSALHHEKEIGGHHADTAHHQIAEAYGDMMTMIVGNTDPGEAARTRIAQAAGEMHRARGHEIVGGGIGRGQDHARSCVDGETGQNHDHAVVRDQLARMPLILIAMFPALAVVLLFEQADVTATEKTVSATQAETIDDVTAQLSHAVAHEHAAEAR